MHEQGWVWNVMLLLSGGGLALAFQWAWGKFIGMMVAIADEDEERLHAMRWSAVQRGSMTPKEFARSLTGSMTEKTQHAGYAMLGRMTDRPDLTQPGSASERCCFCGRSLTYGKLGLACYQANCTGANLWREACDAEGDGGD